MNLPITSRIKRSPLLKTAEELAKQQAQQGGDTSDNDPPKSDPDPKAKRLGTVEGEDQIEKKEVIVPGAKVEKFATTPEEIAAYNKYLQDVKDGKVKRNTKYDDKKENQEVIVKGDDLDYDTTIMKTKKEGTVLQPWEVRQQLRAQTRADRQVNKKRRKLEKYGTFDKKGDFKANDGLSAKDARKAQQAQSGYTQARSMSNNIRTGTESGQKAGDKYYKGQREKDKGEEPETEQEKTSKRKAILAAKNKKAGDTAITTSTTNQQDGAVSVDGANNDFSNAKEFEPLQAPQLDPSSAFRKRSSAFKMTGKSPAAKTLQGNQNRLPQHLQDSIKAAPESPTKLGPLAAIAGKALIGALASKAVSSSKMRSGFKMKGYGKK